jgi:hypothetical protein
MSGLGRVAERQARNLYGRAVGPLRDNEYNVKHENGALQVTLRPDGDRLPSDARVVVIVDYRLRVQIFDCGSVGNPEPPICRRRGDGHLELKGIELESGRTQIRILSGVDRHFCIAWATRSGSEQAMIIGGSDGQGIVRRKVEGLGLVAFDLKLESHLEQPTLEVNGDTNESLYHALAHDARTRAALIPQLIESILCRLVSDHLAGQTEVSMSSPGWKRNWIDWSQRVGGQLPELDPDAGADDRALAAQQCELWIRAILSKTREQIPGGGQARVIGDWFDSEGEESQ